MQNFTCAYILWKDLEKRYPNLPLKNLDVILHKTIAFHKMKPSDPKFDECLFELCDLMCGKGDVRAINNIILEAILIHYLEYCHDHKSNDSLDVCDKDVTYNDDNEEHGYYDEDEEFDIEFEKTMKNLSLMAKFKDYMSKVKEGLSTVDAHIT